jgi:hypothetical protein
MNTKKKLPIEEKITLNYLKQQTDTQNLYHLLHNHGPIMAKETKMDL